MRLYQRFAYYLIGLVMGLFFVAMVFSGKDTRCSYFPNARVLNDLRNKPFHYTENSKAILKQGWVTTNDIKIILTHGDVDFDKSDTKSNNGRLYVIEGQNAAKDVIILEVMNFPNRAELKNIRRQAAE